MKYSPERRGTIVMWKVLAGMGKTIGRFLLGGVKRIWLVKPSKSKLGEDIAALCKYIGQVNSTSTAEAGGQC